MEERSIEDLPFGVILLAREHKRDLGELQEVLKWKYGPLGIGRSEVRALVRYIVREEELDQEARNPSSADPMLGTVDRALSIEIKRMAERTELLSEIAEEVSGTACRVESTGEDITPDQAQDELIGLRLALLEMKKSLVDQKKAENSGTDVNLTVDLGAITSDALKHIGQMEIQAEAKALELPAEAVVTEIKETIDSDDTESE